MNCPLSVKKAVQKASLLRYQLFETDRACNVITTVLWMRLPKPLLSLACPLSQVSFEAKKLLVDLQLSQSLNIPKLPSPLSNLLNPSFKSPRKSPKIFLKFLQVFRLKPSQARHSKESPTSSFPQRHVLRLTNANSERVGLYLPLVSPELQVLAASGFISLASWHFDCHLAWISF